MNPAHKDTKNPPGQIVDRYYYEQYKQAQTISDIVDQSNNAKPLSDYERGRLVGWDEGYKAGYRAGLNDPDCAGS